MELDDIASGIFDESLAIRADDDGIADSKPLRAQIFHHVVEIPDPDGEVLAEVGWDRCFDQVDLLRSHVDPGARHPEVRAVVAQITSEHPGVEDHGLIDIGNIE